MAAVLLVLVAGGAVAAPQADAYVKGPPIYTEDGSSVAEEAEEWLRTYGTDVEAEFNEAGAAKGSRLTKIFGIAGRFAPRVLGWAGIAYGAYEVCDEFFQKGCWLVNQSSKGTPAEAGFAASLGPYVWHVEGEVTKGYTSGGTQSATLNGKYPDLEGQYAYVGQAGLFNTQTQSADYCHGTGPPTGADGIAFQQSVVPQNYSCGGSVGNVTILNGIAYRTYLETTITPPEPTTPNRPGVPDIDTHEFPLPPDFPEKWGDELADGEDDDDVAEEVEKKLPRPIPLPNPGEKQSDYRARLAALGLVGVLVWLTDATLDPDKGPEEVVRTSPKGGDKVPPGTEVKVFANPEDSPVPGPGGGDGAGDCDHHDIRDPDFGPLTELDLASRFPFGVFSWVSGFFGGLIGGGTAPQFDIPMPGGIEPIHVSFAAFTPLMTDWIHPAILIACAVSLVYMLASVLAGLGRPGGGD